jgi:hypothetical protein
MLTVNNTAESDVIVCKGNALAVPNCELNSLYPVSHSAGRKYELGSLFSDILLDFISVFSCVFHNTFIILYSCIFIFLILQVGPSYVSFIRLIFFVEFFSFNN